MDRYELLEKIGEGAFGTVSRARHKESKREVAIKCLKSTYCDWASVASQREIQAINHLCNDCKHLVFIYAILREKDSKVYFVCELMRDGDLKDFLASYGRKKKLVEPEIVRSIMHQILCGIQHIHSKGYMHRDLKPENLLMSGLNCKVADFSLTRPATVVESERRMTSYVSSRWYRAPEILLEAEMYTTAIDIFALGCVMAELVSLKPLFPGKDEHDQLPVVLALLGPMTEREWPEGIRLVKELQISMPPKAQPEDILMPIPRRLANKLHVTCGKTISLLNNLLKLNPEDRPPIDLALHHEFFLHCPPDASPAPPTTPEQQHTAAFDGIAQDRTPSAQTSEMTTAWSAAHRYRAPAVSISSSARETPDCGEYARVQVGHALQEGTAGIVTTSGPSPTHQARPFKRTHDASSFVVSRHRRVVRLPVFGHSYEYRPSHAFGID